MKKTATFIALALVAACSAMAATTVEWLETKHNFGAFDEDLGPVSTTFRFVNRGAEPVAIVAARASCGCTSPEYTREPVAPGDTGRVVVTYNPAGRPGRFTKYVGVDLSEPGNKTKLYVSGTVVGSRESVGQRFPSECGSHLQLAKNAVMAGEVTKGSLRTVFLEGYNRSADSIRPRVDGLPKHIEVNIVPEVVPPGEQMSMIFYLHTDRSPLYGLVADTVQVSAGDGGEGCPVPVLAVVKEDFSKLTPKQLKKAPQARLAEESLDFGALTRTSSEPVERTTTIKNIGHSPLIIRRAYTADEGVTVSVDRTTIKPGKEATVTVRVVPSALPGSLLNARVSLICNDPTAPVRSLRAVGTM